jgi:L-ascorbate metabolism protein UlaG (beta-lactamase superfamily)
MLLADTFLVRGPFGLFGPRRLTPPGATWAALREAADLVVISHSHYDHLSARAMKELGGLPWAVPKGLGPLLESRGGKWCTIDC